MKSTVSSLMSSIISAAMGDMRASVYRMAAARQTGDRAEVSLLVDQHVPHVPFLGHADQRGIDHALAVRMVVAAGVAGDLGAFDPRRPPASGSGRSWRPGFAAARASARRARRAGPG